VWGYRGESRVEMEEVRERESGEVEVRRQSEGFCESKWDEYERERG